MDFSIFSEYQELVKRSNKVPDPLGHLVKELWGFDSLRHEQREIIDCIESGSSLIVAPTSFGKSICFQAPALSSKKAGLTLIISPLRALMRDQVNSLRAKAKFPLPVALLNSDISQADFQRVYAELSQYRLLYITPERIRDLTFMKEIKNVSVRRIIVDEAHFILGKDTFRTAFSLIGRLADTVKAPVSLLTATSDITTSSRILSAVHSYAPRLYVIPPYRENLTFHYGEVSILQRAISNLLLRHPGQSGIVFCQTRKETKLFCEAAKRSLGSSSKHKFLYYHSALGKERAGIEHEFLTGNGVVVFSTNAFGAGIDKPDIRFTIHINIPISFDNLIQETGRAGRDGQPSECYLLHHPASDRAKKILRHSSPAYDEVVSVTEAAREKAGGFQRFILCDRGDITTAGILATHIDDKMPVLTFTDLSTAMRRKSRANSDKGTILKALSYASRNGHGLSARELPKLYRPRVPLTEALSVLPSSLHDSVRVIYDEAKANGRATAFEGVLLRKSGLTRDAFTQVLAKIGNLFSRTPSEDREAYVVGVPAETSENIARDIAELEELIQNKYKASFDFVRICADKDMVREFVNTYYSIDEKRLLNELSVEIL